DASLPRTVPSSTAIRSAIHRPRSFESGSDPSMAANASAASVHRPSNTARAAVSNSSFTLTPSQPDVDQHFAQRTALQMIESLMHLTHRKHAIHDRAHLRLIQRLHDPRPR